MGGEGADHGHGHGDFRNKVWSMTGGPNCRPKHWKRNTAIAMFGVFLVCIPIFKLSAKLEGLCVSVSCCNYCTLPKEFPAKLIWGRWAVVFHLYG